MSSRTPYPPIGPSDAWVEGECVGSTTLGGNYGSGFGTSFVAPAVSGAAARGTTLLPADGLAVILRGYSTAVLNHLEPARAQVQRND